MDFDTDRWIGRSAKPDIRFLVFLGRRTCQPDSRGYEIKLLQPMREPNKLAGAIVAALDRDSALRHEYLMKRWRGMTA